MTTVDSDYVTPEEALQRTGIDPDVLYKVLADEVVPTVRKGAELRVDLAAVGKITAQLDRQQFAHLEGQELSIAEAMVRTGLIRGHVIELARAGRLRVVRQETTGRRRLYVNAADVAYLQRLLQVFAATRHHGRPLYPLSGRYRGPLFERLRAVAAEQSGQDSIEDHDDDRPRIDFTHLRRLVAEGLPQEQLVQVRDTLFEKRVLSQPPFEVWTFAREIALARDPHWQFPRYRPLYGSEMALVIVRDNRPCAGSSVFPEIPVQELQPHYVVSDRAGHELEVVLNLFLGNTPWAIRWWFAPFRRWDREDLQLSQALRVQQLIPAFVFLYNGASSCTFCSSLALHWGPHRDRLNQLLDAAEEYGRWVNATEEAWPQTEMARLLAQAGSSGQLTALANAARRAFLRETIAGTRQDATAVARGQIKIPGVGCGGRRLLTELLARTTETDEVVAP